MCCVFVPLTETLRIQLFVFFFAYPFRFLKVLSQLDRIIEEALYLYFTTPKLLKTKLEVRVKHTPIRISRTVVKGPQLECSYTITVSEFTIYSFEDRKMTF